MRIVILELQDGSFTIFPFDINVPAAEKSSAWVMVDKY